MKSTKNRDRNITHFLYVLPNLIMYSFLSIVPIVLGLYYSFTNWNGIGKNYKFVGLKNYIKILSDNRFRKAVLFNIRYAAMLIICVMLLSVVLALLMNTKIRGQNCFRAIYFFPACVSMLTIGLIFNYIFFQGIPSLGTSLGIEALQKNILSGRSTAIYGILITNIWKSVAIPTVLVISALQTIPGEIIEAAIWPSALLLHHASLHSAYFKYYFCPCPERRTYDLRLHYGNDLRWTGRRNRKYHSFHLPYRL